MPVGLLIYDVDREDGMLMGLTATFELPKQFETYEEAIQSILPKLSSPEVVKKVIEECYLEEKLGEDEDFDEDDGAVKTIGELVFCGYRNYALEYEFESGVEVSFSLEFVEMF